MSPVLRRGTKKRRHRSRIHPLVIALAMILATVFITAYAFNQGIPFVHKFTLYAVVNNSVNVRADSPVRIAGIDVGSVAGVSPAGRATKIAFTLDDSGQPIHADATIRIRDRLFLEGGYYLELDPGSPSAPTLHDGGMIPESQTSSPVQFYSVLSTFDSATRQSLKDLIGTLNQGFGTSARQSLSQSGAGAFKRAIPELTPTLKDVALVTRALHGTQPGDVERLLSSASQVTGTLANNSSQLVDLIGGLNRTSSALAASDGALGQSVVGLDQTLQVAPAALTAIDRALPPLANLATALDPSLKEAPPILDQVTGAVRELAVIVAPAERAALLTSLKATFKQFPSILSELATAFPITKQVTDCLQTHVTPTLKQVVPDGSLTSGRPVWQDFVHFLPGVAGASGNFDANGPFTRVVAAAGTNSVNAGLLGSLPGLGQLLGTAPPGNGGSGSITGISPQWVGDLPASAFRPDAPCATQKVPSLAAPSATSDLHPRTTPSAAPVTRAQLRAEIARGQRAVHPR